MGKKLDAVIGVCNTQSIDGETEKIEMSVVGTLSETEEGWLLEYTEYDEDARKSQTAVRVTGNQTVSVTRTGELTGEMLFERGKRNSMVYSTPYGNLSMGVYTKSIENTLSESGGRLRFCYTTDFHSQAPIENRMTLTVSPK